MNTIRIGTRGSRLALAQTQAVIALLRAERPHIVVETVVIRTTGDEGASVPPAQMGAKGVFVKEIEEALLAGKIDAAVHSLKDLPGDLAAGLVIAAIPAREDPRDALLSRGPTLGDLPEGAIVGTSSLRRQAQIRALRPDLQIRDLRGNVDTRIRKLDEGEYDAIVLACAGLQRLGLADRITERLSLDQSVPAPGQGALAIQARAEDGAVQALFEPLSHRQTADCVAAERAFQARLGAGCALPAGACATLCGEELQMTAMIGAPDGGAILRTRVAGRRYRAAELGARAADELIARGGGDILKWSEQVDARP